MMSESLPFTIDARVSEKDYHHLLELRGRAYSLSGYSGPVVESLKQPCLEDRQAKLFVAREKSNQKIIGTFRLTTKPNASFVLPPGFEKKEVGDDMYTYIDRMAVAPVGNKGLVFLSLMKAVWLWSLKIEKADWILAAAREPFVKKYCRVGLRKLNGAEGGFFIPELHETRYWALGERMTQLESNIQQNGKALLPFFYEKNHPDIHIEPN